MNVVLGGNESGKSSWVAALFSGLCGMRRGRGRMRLADQEFHDRHRPWGGGRWSTSVKFQSSNGEKLVAIRDLEDHSTCSLKNRVTGADLSGQLDHDGCPDGSKLLELHRDVMGSTLFVGQAEVLAVADDAASLQQSLQRAAGGASDATADAALMALQEHHAAIGTDRSHTKPYMVAKKRVGEAESKLDDVNGRREALDEEYRSLDEISGAREIAEAVLNAAKAAEVFERLTKLEGRLAEIEPLVDEFGEKEPPQRVGELDKAYTEAQKVLARFDSLPNLPDKPNRDEIEFLEKQLASLPNEPLGDRHPHPSVVSAYQEWVAATRVIERLHGADRGAEALRLAAETTPSELRVLADAIDRGAASARTGPSPALVAGGVGLATGVVMAVVGQPVAGAVVGLIGLLVAGLRWLIRQEVSRGRSVTLDAGAARRRAEQLGLEMEATAIRVIARQVERALGDASESEQAVASRETAAETLCTALINRGAETADDLAAAHATYVAECERQAQHAEEAARRPGVEATLAALRKDLDAFEALVSRASDLGGELRSVADKLSVSSRGTPNETAAALRATLAATEGGRDELADTYERYSRLQHLLDGETQHQLKEQLGDLNADLAELGDFDPGTASDPPDIDVLEGMVEDLAGDWERHRGEISRAERDLPATSEVEEELARAVERFERLARERRLVEQSMRFLKDAKDEYYKTIAPKLRDAIRSRIGLITGGRYSEVTIDPATLEIQTKVVGGGYQSVRNLSHGTAEQFYLLLRVALVETLVTNGESAFIVLDDVTVQSDAERTVAILELLHGVSADHQIILFSQEEEVAQWARQSLKSRADSVIDLEPIR